MGRPRKDAQASTSSSVQAPSVPGTSTVALAVSAAGAPIQKRKRGRPRKNPLVVPQNASLPSQPKKDASLQQQPNKNALNEPVFALEPARKVICRGRPPSKSVTQEDIMAITSPAQLVNILNNLVGKTQSELFRHYKKTSKQRISTLENEIQKLKDQLSAKQNTIDTLFRRIHLAEMKHKLHVLASVDMLQLLTGVRFVKFRQDEHQYYLDAKQTSTENGVDVSNPAAVLYRIVIPKDYEVTDDVLYIPQFIHSLDAKAAEEEQKIRKKLATEISELIPEVMCQNMRIPFTKLLQVYDRMALALRKTGKEMHPAS